MLVLTPSLVGTQNNKFIGELLGTIEKSYRRAAIEAREIDEAWVGVQTARLSAKKINKLLTG